MIADKFRHLLGKKSWNVYNQDNIEKVRRDEARAKAKEEAEEERMQEIDARRRLQILRGEEPSPPPASQVSNASLDEESRPTGLLREKRKRKRHGEDDTEFEMRIANERAQAVNTETQVALRRPVEAPLVDRHGHIDLFPQEQPKASAKNPEVEKELAKKKKEYEDQYTVKFSDAAGYNAGLDDPWYSKNGLVSSSDMPGKDAFGREDPQRKDRDSARIVSNDPLAMMRQGAAQARKVDKERKAWNEQRERELAELKKTEHKERRRRHRHRSPVDDLEGFSLDASSKRSHHDNGDERAYKHKDRHRHTRRSRSRERARSRSRDRHRSRH